MKYESKFKIGQEVKFQPSYVHCSKYNLQMETYSGIIISIKFTKNKIFYDIVDNSWGILFDNIDSINIITN